MRTFLVLTAAMIVLSPIVFGSDCASAVDVRHRVHDGKVEFIAKNISGKPMVAYVIATDARDANGALINMFSGVFTDGDSLQPGKALAIGSTSATDSDLKPRVDYVRLADGWSCGGASTEQAKAAIARFQK